MYREEHTLKLLGNLGGHTIRPSSEPSSSSFRFVSSRGSEWIAIQSHIIGVSGTNAVLCVFLNEDDGQEESAEPGSECVSGQVRCKSERILKQGRSSEEPVGCGVESSRVEWGSLIGITIEEREVDLREITFTLETTFIVQT